MASDERLKGIDIQAKRTEESSADHIISEVAQTVGQAMVEAFPSLGPCRSRFLGGDQIKICTEEEVDAVRELDRPTKNNIFFQALSQTGISAESLKRYLPFWSLPSYISMSSGEPVLYLIETRGIDIESKSLDVRSVAIALLAWELVQRNLEIVPEVYEPTNRVFWRELAREKMDQEVEEVIFGFPIVVDRQAKLNARDLVAGSLDRPDAKFLSRGAKVQVSFPLDEETSRFQYEVGFSFDIGANVFIAETAELRATELLVGKNLLPRGVLGAYENFKRNRLKNNPFLGKTRSTLRNLNLKSREEALLAYLGSTIPYLYTSDYSESVNGIDPLVTRRFNVLDYPD